MPHPPPHSHSVSDSTPLGILCLGGSCKNSAKPHWCWISDYTPFGFGMPERSYSSTAAGYRWGFQAQESDDELFGEGNASFFKYRISDNRIGRFFAVDPLAPEYPWNSPYAFSENRVFDGIELEGLEWVNVNADGEETSVNFDPGLPLTPEEQAFVNGLPQPPTPQNVNAPVNGQQWNQAVAFYQQMHNISNENPRGPLAYGNNAATQSPLLQGMPGGQNVSPAVYNAIVTNTIQAMANNTGLDLTTPNSLDLILITNQTFLDPRTLNNIFNHRCRTAHNDYLFPNVFGGVRDNNLLSASDFRFIQGAIATNPNAPPNATFVGFRTHPNGVGFYIMLDNQGQPTGGWIPF